MLVFDGDCGFCTRSAQWAARRLPSGVEVIAWQGVPDLGALGLLLDDVATASYWIDAEGRPHRGARGIAMMLIEIGGFWRFAGWLVLLPGLSVVAGFVYRLVARNRHRMPGGTVACRVEDRGPRA